MSQLSGRRGFWRRDAVLASSLVLFTLVFHAGALGAWWTEDDPQLLLQVMREDVGSTLFAPERWRLYSASNFVPLLILSYKMDYALFGLQPHWFYVHQLLSLSLAAVLVFALARRWAAGWVAWLACAALAASPAAVYAARTLMVRHYVEGLALAGLAVWIWSARRRGSDGAAAALYLIAALAKEVYAPLPLVFLADSWVRREPLRVVVRRLLPSAFAALVYASWRVVMLGSAGGYGTPISGESAALLPLRLWVYIRGPAGWLPGVLWLAAILFGFAASGRRPGAWRAWIAAVALMVFVFLPLIPVSGPLSARFTLVPTVVVAVLVAASVEQITGRSARVAVLLAFFVGAALCGSQQLRWLGRFYGQAIAEGRYVWSAPRTSAPLLASGTIWYLDGLRTLRKVLHNSDPPTIYASEYGVLIDAIPSELLVEADSRGRIGPIPAQRRADLARLSRRFRPDQPFRVSVARRGNVLQWSLAPPARRWMYLSVPMYKSLIFEEAGAFRFPATVHPPSLLLDPPVRFRMLRETNDGWTVTPELSLPETGRGIRWEQPGSKTARSSS